ncbi:MAG: LysM peptidoglycan-binding domain-containing protein [Thermoguttaceae bacterium]
MSSHRAGAKLFVAFALLGGAFLLAHPFRHRGVREDLRTAPMMERVVLRETPVPDGQEALRPEAPTAEIQPTLLAPPPAAGERPRLDEGLPRLAPPPAMARTFPGSATVAGDPLPATDPSGRRLRRIHQVRDGDTLEDLARRYLGDPSRWPEIFQANRDQIQDPQLLPLSARLVIPPRSPVAEGESAESEDRSVSGMALVPMVP